MQDELAHLRELLNPRKPFLAVVGGGKYDTKIGPLNEIYKKVRRGEHDLLLGFIMLCSVPTKQHHHGHLWDCAGGQSHPWRRPVQRCGTIDPLSHVNGVSSVGVCGPPVAHFVAKNHATLA